MPSESEAEGVSENKEKRKPYGFSIHKTRFPLFSVIRLYAVTAASAHSVRHGAFFVEADKNPGKGFLSKRARCKRHRRLHLQDEMQCISLLLGTSLSEGGKYKRRKAFVPVPIRKIFLKFFLL